MLVKWRNLLGKLDPGCATVGQPRSILSIPFRVDTIRGPWFSLGFHIDFQKPYFDIHFIWWIITFGKSYEYEIVEEEGYPLAVAESTTHTCIELEPATSPVVVWFSMDRLE